MARFALGLIETVGLAAAVEAADAAVKSANIELVGYELTKGGGMVTIKLQGEVGAVNAAVEAGCAAAERINKVFGRLVIPRPHEDMDKIVYSKETVGSERKTTITNLDVDMNKPEMCNLCNDPECTRKKGELKTLCIHNKSSNKN